MVVRAPCRVEWPTDDGGRKGIVYRCTQASPPSIKLFLIDLMKHMPKKQFGVNIHKNYQLLKTEYRKFLDVL